MFAAASVALGHTPDRGADLPWQLDPLARQPIPMPVKQAPEPPLKPTPRAVCGADDRPEPGMQGRVSAEDVSSGRAADGFRCNITQVGHSGSAGGFKVHRYVDRAGRECAYYDTTLLYPLDVSKGTGVAVLDMSDPANPARTDTLVTPAMQTPHESVNISARRGLLVAVMGTGTFYPGQIDVYDLKDDCRRPTLLSSLPVGLLGHESGFAPDGMTYYAASLFTRTVTAVDLSNPRLPRPLWVGNYNSHGMSISDDGNRAYVAAIDGLIILDVSEIQSRVPDPQVREVSRLVWDSMSVPQIAIPVTIGGRPYLVEMDEYSRNDPEYISSNGMKVGAARIIDISEETRPRVVSNIRLEVNQPENRATVHGDPGARSQLQGYAGHYCNVPRRADPGIVACTFILSGLRVFDIRDPEAPREIAYFVAPPAPSPLLNERTNYAMASPDFAPERGEIWYSDGNSGFYALKVDRDVWPFPRGEERAAPCIPDRGLRAVSARPRRSGVRLGFRRGRKLPVRVEVLRVERGRRRLVARFHGRRRPFTWDGRANRGRRRAVPPGRYVVSFTMLRGGRRVARRELGLERRRSGSFVRRRGLDRAC